MHTHLREGHERALQLLTQDTIDRDALERLRADHRRAADEASRRREKEPLGSVPGVSDKLLERLTDGAFHRFESLFTVEEGRLGVVVTFLGMLELAKERLLDIVQEGSLAPIYVKSLAAGTDSSDALEFSSEFDDADAANDPTQ